MSHVRTTLAQKIMQQNTPRREMRELIGAPIAAIDGHVRREKKEKRELRRKLIAKKGSKTT